MTRFVRMTVMLSLAASTAAMAVAGEHAASAQAGGATLRFRRVFVPQEDITRLTRGYMPMERDVFETRLERIAARMRSAALPGARATTARYYAVFDGHDLVNGMATLQIECPTDAPATVALHPFGLAAGPATWRHDATAEPAVTGSDAAGQFVVLAEHSGQLRIPWSLRGAADAAGNAVFQFQVPATPRKQLILDLPADTTATVEHGLVGAVNHDSLLSRQTPLPALPPKHRRQLVDLGGTETIRLRIANKNAPGRRQRIQSWQDTKYDIDVDGLRVTYKLRIDVDERPLEQLVLESDAQLEVTAVQVDGTDAVWRITPTPLGRARQLCVVFPKAITDATAMLHVTAVATLRVDTTWKLPTLHVPGVLWRQGTIAVASAPSVELCSIVPHHARTTGIPEIPPTEGNHTYRFQLFDPGGAVDVFLRRRGPRVTTEMGTTIHAGRSVLTAVAQTDLHGDFGQQFTIDARVPGVWTIDGIDATPVDAIQGYRFVGRARGMKQLQVQLSHALAPTHNIRLTVRAHRTHGFRLRPDAFRPIRFTNPEQTRSLVAISADPSYRLLLRGDGQLTRIDPTDVSKQDADRLNLAGPNPLVFVDDENADLVSIRMTRDVPVFAATVRVDVEVSKRVYRESYRVVCRPESVPMDRFLVHLSASHDEDIHWLPTDDANRALRVERLGENAQRNAGLSAGGETWRVILPHPTDQPVEVSGWRETPISNKMVLALASLPAATSQEGWLSVASLLGDALSIDAQAARRIPLAVTPPDQFTPVRARYRYAPARSPRVVVTRLDARNGPARAWAWDSQLTSWFTRDGSVRHRAVYRLENRGATRLAIELPKTCTMRGLELDGRPLPAESPRDRRCAVSLPSRRRFVTVTVNFTGHVTPGRYWMSLTGALPVLDIPVLDQHWTAWLPPGYVAWRNDDRVWPPAPTALGWKQRLFGALAAPPGQRPFQPLIKKDWSRLLGQNSPVSTARNHARLWLDLVGKSLLDLDTQNEETPTRNWRSLFRVYHRRVRSVPSGLPFRMLVDALVLAENGFSIDQPLPAPVDGPPVVMATTLLARANLVVVAHAKTLLLTSAAGLCRYPHSTESIESRVIALVTPGSVLARQLEEADQTARRGRVDIAMWATQPALPGSPWQHGNELADRTLTMQPCQVCAPMLSGVGHGALTVYRPVLVMALGWAVLLIATGLQSSIGPRQPRHLVPVLVVVGAVAMAVPDAIVPITSNLLLGLLLGIMLQVARRRRHDASVGAIGSTRPVSTLVTGGVTRAVVLIVLLLAAARTSSAQDSAAGAATKPAPPVYRVFTPIDDAQKPIGNYDYLPLELYDAVHRASSLSGVAGRRWVIRRANYHAIFNWRQQRSALDLTQLTAIYRLQAVQARQRIRIPWPATRGVLEPIEARLAGQPVELAWNEAGTAFTVVAMAEGATQLELMLRPAIQESNALRSFRFAVPSVPQAALDVDAPLDATGLEVPTRRGPATTDVESGLVEYTLGPVAQLEMQWPVTPKTKRPRLELEQLMWLRVQPANETPVVLTTKLRFRTFGEPLRQITLRADKSLQLITLDDALAKQVDTPLVRDENRQRIFTFPLRQPVAGEFTLSPRFQVAGVTGFGNLCMPHLTCEDAAVTRRWCAVSTAPNLELVPAASSNIDVLDAAEFLNAWGPMEQAPRWACRLADSDPPWTLLVRGRAPQTKVRQQIDEYVGHAAIDWMYRAEVDTAQGDVSQHRFHVPRTAHVTTVNVSAEGTPIAARVTQGPADVATVFLTRAISGTYQIELRGTIALPRLPAQVPLPVVTAENAEIVSHRVHIYRRLDVLVMVANPGNAVAREATSNGRYFEGLGRRVATVDVPAEPGSNDPSMTLTVRLNRPTTTANLVTTLQRQDTQWEAAVGLQVMVSGGKPGVVDAVRLEVPEEWQGPFTMDPPVAYQLQAFPDQRRAQLVLWPDQPISTRYTVRIHSPLKFGANERVRTPDIVPLDITDAQRFYVLPTRWDQQRIQWKTSGLQPVRFADVMPAATPKSGEWSAYRIWSRFRISSQPRAVITDVRRVAGEPRISLADVHVACHGDGRCHGLVTFRLEPAGAKRATLLVPEGVRLIWIGVDQTPATPVALADRHWRIRLGPPQLPQQVTVVFAGRITAASTPITRDIAVPWITDFAVQQTAWTVRRAPPLVAPSAVASEYQVPTVGRVATRLRDASEILEGTSDIAIDSPPDEVANWYTPWAIRLATDVARVRSYQAAQTPRELTGGVALEPLLKQQEDVAQRLKTEPILEQALRTTITHPQPVDLWEQSRRPGDPTIGFVMPSARAKLAVPWQPRTRTALPLHAGILLVLISAGAIALSLWPAFWVWFQPSRRWWVWGIAVGLIWWIACRPSWFGLLIVMGVACGAVGRQVYKAARATQPDD